MQAIKNKAWSWVMADVLDEKRFVPWMGRCAKWDFRCQPVALDL